MHTQALDLRQRLKAAGLRPTRQRLHIATLLFAKGDRHLTAETLYAEAKNTRYPPSLATIYNALRDFAACGLVREIALYGSRTWYDTKTGPHFHYYVEECDDLFDIPEEHIPKLNVPIPQGMRVAGVDVIIRLEKTSEEPLPLAAE
ncbi:MAG: transcriptional repressor [Hyphomicrobiales bacterium]|nr:transcriptional repressor [Hyphomicrobiales bacterium]